MATEDKDQTAEEQSVVEETTTETGNEAGTEAADVSETEQLDIDPIKAKDEEISRLQQEVSDLKDQYLRKQADLDNFRKRLQREKEEAIAFANKQLLTDIITIIDNFERAIQSSEGSRDFDSLHDGIVMIEKEFIGMLERKWQLVRFESEGQEFDPNRHEAMMMEESTEHDTQVVLQDFQKGYMLRDSVLRAAKVKVSQPVAPAEDSAE